VARAALDRYRAKRDFRRSPEPEGGAAAKGEARLAFVVQRHAARRLHYDLRLEWGGVLKSWAVTRGPSLDPADKRLAVEVEDHPLDYGEFEGVIPKPGYGAGVVQIFDRGAWAPLDPTQVEANLAKGELKFVLAGERLRGGFLLVRLKPRRGENPRQPNWLLIKERDSMARPGEGDAVLQEETSIVSGRTLEGIERAGDAPAIPDFVEPQLCRLVDTPPTGAAWRHEPKLDGYRIQLRVEGGRARLRTRTGLDWTERFAGLARAARALPDGLADGEVVALDREGRPSFGALQAHLAGEGRAKLLFHLFDLLHDGARDLRKAPLRERKSALRDWLGRNPAPADPPWRLVEDFDAPGVQMLASACRLSLEGIVSKRQDAPHASGRGEAWVKSKCRGREEFVVAGWSPQASGHGIGALLLGLHREGRLVYAGRVGTGFGAAVTARLLPRLRDMARPSAPFDEGGPARASDVNWTRPEMVVEIAHGGWTEEGLLRHASFLGEREDKPAAEVKGEAAAPASGLASEAARKEGAPSARKSATPPARKSAAPPARKSAAPPARKSAAPPARKSAAPPARKSATARKSAAPPARKSATPASHPADPQGARATKPKRKAAASPAPAFAVSHPERALWPGPPPVTKGELAQYYERFAEPILAHIAGRPLSVLRAPGGMGKGLFFQRHAGAALAGALREVRIEGQDKPYMAVEDAAGLAALAQMSVVELHPWGAMADRPETPDRLVFDLDPAEGVAMPAILACAKEMRARLKDLGLAAFPHVTGGKGLHLVVPLAIPARGAAADWAAAKSFARLLCTLMVRDAPDRYTVTLAKKARVGKIFLDYLRNDRLSTAIANWSPRARPGAPVARPIAWSAVRAGLDPAGATLPDLAAGALPRDPWAGFAAAAIPLNDAIRRLTR